MNLKPKMWENLINSESGMPVVVHSIQRVMDGRWHVENVSMHDEFELVYVQKAESAFFEICGEKVNVRTKDLLLIKPRQPHKLDVYGNNLCQFLVLKFCFMKKYTSNIADVSLDDFLDFVSNKETGAYIRITSPYRNEIVSALQRIIAEGKNPDESSEFLSSLLVMEIFVLLSRSLKIEWENSMKHKGDKLHELMETARAYINENYMNNISLQDVASFIYLSTSHFARAFKKEFGVSTIQYLLSLRVEKAKELLTMTDLKIGEIARQVGFATQQRFNDIFKKQTHLSPTQFRNNYKNSIMNQ